MDGVLVFREKTTDSLVRALRITPYFPELRGIMVHDEKGRIEPGILEKRTGLPIIVIKSLPRSSGHVRKLSRRPNNSRSRQSSLDPSNLQKIMALTTIKGVIPEPLRIAHLLAKLPIFRNIAHDKR